MDERSALVDDLLEKRERINEAAMRQRDMRDRLNDQTRAHAHRRDEFNAQVRSLVDQANAHKARRDEINAKVREGKQKRDALNRLAHEKAEVLASLRREEGVQAGVPLPKLRAEIRRLEYEQQTKVMTPKKEKELIDLIGAKLREIKEREKAYEATDALQEAYDEMKQAKADAEVAHAEVTELATGAQSEHEQMVRLYNEADTIRKQADAAQGDFVKSKVEADGVHREYIEMINQIRDLERVSSQLRPRQDGRPGASMQTHAAADAIFDRFRKGEKLSTEDLMALQKAGRL